MMLPKLPKYSCITCDSEVTIQYKAQGNKHRVRNCSNCGPRSFQDIKINQQLENDGGSRIREVLARQLHLVRRLFEGTSLNHSGSDLSAEFDNDVDVDVSDSQFQTGNGNLRPHNMETVKSELKGKLKVKGKSASSVLSVQELYSEESDQNRHRHRNQIQETILNGDPLNDEDDDNDEDHFTLFKDKLNITNKTSTSLSKKSEPTLLQNMESEQSELSVDNNDKDETADLSELTSMLESNRPPPIVLNMYPGHFDVSFMTDHTSRPLPLERITYLNATRIVQKQVDEELQCLICHEEFALSEWVICLKCNHFYHTGCIITWLSTNGSCPLCRSTDFNPDEINLLDCRRFFRNAMK